MPTSKSAAKRLRQNVARRAKNRSVKRDLHTRVKSVQEALSETDVDRAQELFRVAVKKLDQAAAKGIIHRNAAARRKSRMAAKLKAESGKRKAES
jgi:small subunit ribosomal protein S20